jgi:SPP1 gp7 family putative phage head morphogenesis protein
MAKFILPRRIETEYQTSMHKLLKAFSRKPNTDVDTWLYDLASLSHMPEFMDLATQIARRMAVQVNIQNAKTWREAAHRSSRSQMLYRALQREMNGGVGVRFNQIIADNARLITRIPEHVSGVLANQIAKGQQQGIRPETMAKALRDRFPELTTSRIHLISRTQVAMASTALTQARSEDLGLTHFEWDTSQDARVRPSHRLMSGVLVAWNDLPSPEKLAGMKSSLGAYGPGQCQNCRCIPSVLLALEDVSWPRKVYSSGSITRLTRAQFQKQFGFQDRIAA